MYQSIVRALPSTLLFAEVTKIVIKGADISDAIVAACLCALVGVFHVYNHIKFMKELQEKFDAASKETAALSEKIELASKDAADAKSYVSSIKLSNQMRQAR